MRDRLARVMGLLVVVALCPTLVHAQSRVAYAGVFTPYVGTTTGGDASGSNATVGASLGVVESRGWGTELDIAHASSLGDEGFENSALTSLMISATYIWTRHAIQPFGSVGAGVMRLSGVVQPDGSTQGRTDLGAMFGGGVHYEINDVFGVRGDLRYLRYFESHPDIPVRDVFSTWRVAVGVTLNWPLEP